MLCSEEEPADRVDLQKWIYSVLGLGAGKWSCSVVKHQHCQLACPLQKKPPLWCIWSELTRFRQGSRGGAHLLRWRRWRWLCCCFCCCWWCWRWWYVPRYQMFFYKSCFPFPSKVSSSARRDLVLATRLLFDDDATLHYNFLVCRRPESQLIKFTYLVSSSHKLQQPSCVPRQSDQSVIIRQMRWVTYLYRTTTLSNPPPKSDVTDEMRRPSSVNYASSCDSKLHNFFFFRRRNRLGEKWFCSPSPA